MAECGDGGAGPMRAERGRGSAAPLEWERGMDPRGPQPHCVYGTAPIMRPIF